MNGHATARGSIVGVVSAVPARVIMNADCPDPAAADEAAKLTGVLERRWVGPEQSARTLCTDAAKRLLDRLAWDPKSIDVLVYVTQTPERAVPADVYSIAADLGVPVSCACLQINWSCAGYVYGLWTAMRLLQHGQRALLLVGDATSTISDPRDRATAPLFGDAGSATAICADDANTHHFVFGTDGRGAMKLGTQREFDGMHIVDDNGTPVLMMDGASVFSFTLKRVPPLLADVLKFGRPDWVCFHQANKFILQHLVKKTGLLDTVNPAQVPVNLEEFGNCSSASIPLLICTELAGNGALNDSRMALLGYGAGWAWAGASIQIGEPPVVELIEV